MAKLLGQTTQINAPAITSATSQYLGSITHSNTIDRVYTLPDNAGTIALTSDVSNAVTTSEDTTSIVGYPIWTTSVGGTSLKTTSTKLSFNPSTGSLTVNSASVRTATITTTATTANQVIVTLSNALYRSVEFIIQGVDATGTKYQTTKVLAIHNGTTAEWVEYGSVQIGGVVGVFSVDYSSGIRLLVTPASANSTVFKVTCIANAV